MSFTASLCGILAENQNGLLSQHHTWHRVRLGDVADILNGFPFPSSQFTSGEGFPLLRIRDVLSATTDARFVGQFDPQYVVRPGELVVGMDGDFNCALWAGPEALLNQRVCKVTPDERFLSRRYLSFVLPGYLNAVNANTPSITVKHLSSFTVADLPLPLPPREEQERLADELEDYFSRLDEAVALLERVQRNLKRYRASVLKAAVEGRLVPTEAELARAEGRTYEPASVLLERILDERRRRWEQSGRKGKYQEPAAPDTTDLPELPEGWCWASVDQIGEAVTGTTPSTARPDYYGGPVPFIKPTDLDAGYQVCFGRQTLTEAGARLARLLPAGSVLVTCIGATIGKTGLARVVCATNQQINALVPEPSLREVPYLFWFFSGPLGQGEVIGSASSTTLPILNKSRFERLAVPLPPLAEQHRTVIEIERLLSIADELVSEVRRNFARCTRLRQSILKWAFEGRLADQDPTDEPASVLLERIRAERAASGASKSTGRRRKATAPPSVTINAAADGGTNP